MEEFIMMITAKEIRKDLGIDENATIKDVFMDYFQNHLKALKEDQCSKDSKGYKQYGLIIDTKEVLYTYGLTEDTITKDILHRELDKFFKDLEKLGFKVNVKTFLNSKWYQTFSVCWLNHFENLNSEQECNFI